MKNVHQSTLSSYNGNYYSYKRLAQFLKDIPDTH